MYCRHEKNKTMANIIVTIAFENVSSLNSNVITVPIEPINAVKVPM